MSTTEVSTDSPTDTPKPGTIAMKLEVVAVPVSDVDRAKEFYASLGWRLDADFELGEDVRLEIVVSDIEEAREDLISRGVEVSDFFHRGESGFEPGLDPERSSYNSYATFSDPDGNGFIIQEVTERLAGRVWED